MRIAIMQPYFLPYLGYWQLIAAVDCFVVLDDVNFIKGGWVNRNRVVVGGKPSWLTLPLVGASPNRLICEIDIKPDDGWRAKLQRMVAMNYAKAPHLSEGLPWFESCLERASGNLSEYLVDSVVSLCTRLGVTTEIIPSSRPFDAGGLRGSERIVDMCCRLGATYYVNPPGGKDLYSIDNFAKHGIRLEFLEPQLANACLAAGVDGGSSLSILHLMMHNSTAALAEAIGSYRTVAPAGDR